MKGIKSSTPGRSLLLLMAVGMATGSAAGQIIATQNTSFQYTHFASFGGNPVTLTTPAAPGVLPLFPGQSGTNTVINGVGVDRSNAFGSVSHTFAAPNFHLIFLANTNAIFVNDTNGSLDALGLGNTTASFRLDVSVDFTLGAGGLPATNIFLNLPLFGNAPIGYQVDFSSAFTWTDLSTDGDAPAAAVTLSDSATFSQTGAFVGGLLDLGNFGGVTANAGDVFRLSGFFEIEISKAILAGGPALAAPNIGLDFLDQIAIDFDFIIPGPGTAPLLAVAGLLAARRRRG